MIIRAKVGDVQGELEVVKVLPKKVECRCTCLPDRPVFRTHETWNQAVHRKAHSSCKKCSIKFKRRHGDSQSLGMTKLDRGHA